MPRQELDILSPLAGASKELGFQTQAPYSSPELLNIWPRDPFHRRRRCGSRPRLKKAFEQQLGGTSVDLIAEVREATGTLGSGTTESFDGPMTNPPWNPAAASPLNWGGGYSSEFPTISNSRLQHTRPGTIEAVVRDALSPAIDATKEYTFTANIDTAVGAYARNSWFGFYVRMNDTTPNFLTTGGVLISLSWSTNNVNGFTNDFTLGINTNNSSGVQVAGDTTSSSRGGLPNTQRKFKIVARIAADNTADKIVVTATDLTSNGAASLTLTATLTTAAAGKRFGLAVYRELGGVSDVFDWSLSFTEASLGLSGVSNRIVTVGNGQLLEEDNAGTLNATTETTNPTAGRLLQAVDLRGKLYIVNYAADTGNSTTEPSFLVYDPSNNSLKSMRDLNLDLGGSYTAVLPDGLATTAIKCELITSYRDALLFAGKRGDGNEWYLTKRGTTPETIAAASAPEGSATAFVADTSVTSFVIGSTSEAGRIGEPITALMRHSDDYMLFGCQSSVWILRGDPNIGGTIDVLDPRHGVISASAHCRGPGSSSFFLALDGLYVIPYGGQQEPIPLSKKLPQELRYINIERSRAFLAYDVVHEGIIIAVTRTDGGKGSYFFYDMDTQGFFPMEFPTNCEPTFLHYYSADAPGQRAVLFGGRDGYIRQFDDFGQSQNDDGIDFTSRMKLGPILLAPTGYSDGMIREVIPQTAIGSGDVTMFVQVGNNAEEAHEAVERGGFTAHAGLQLTWTPNLRGNACYVGFEKTGGSAWAMEKTTIVREPFGKLRP